MFIADAQNLIQFDGGALLTAAGILGTAITGAITLAMRMWVGYRREVDELERKQKDDHLKREEELSIRADEREKQTHLIYKDTIDKFLKLSESSVGIQVSLAAKIDGVSKDVNGFNGKLDTILDRYKQNQHGKGASHT